MSARQFQRCVHGPSPHASACAVGVGLAERHRTSPRGPATRSNGTDMALLSAGALAESAIGFDARPGSDVPRLSKRGFQHCLAVSVGHRARVRRR